MKRIITITSLCIVAGIIIVGVIYVFKYSNMRSVKANEIKLKNAIIELDQNIDTIELNRLTPFTWDKIYFFAPYTDREIIYNILGIRWHGIQTSVSEGTMQVVFVKENKVVCYCQGYISGSGYYLNCKLQDDQLYKILFSKDGPVFKVTREAEYIFLEYVENKKKY